MSIAHCIEIEFSINFFCFESCQETDKHLQAQI